MAIVPNPVYQLLVPVKGVEAVPPSLSLVANPEALSLGRRKSLPLAELQKRRAELAIAYSDSIGGNETVWLLHRVTRELEAIRAKLRRLAN